MVNYIDLLRENPDLPLFVLSEIRTNPQLFSEQLRVRPLLQNSALVKQLKEKTLNYGVSDLFELLTDKGTEYFLTISNDKESRKFRSEGSSWTRY